MTTDVVMLKSTSVLEFVGTYHAAGEVVFRHPDRSASPKDRTYHAERLFSMTMQDWKELGQPRKITITIEPGDRLNG